MSNNVFAQKNKFFTRLMSLGFRTYQDYLRSDHWKNMRREYQLSNLPKWCIVCRSPIYQLHHRSYTRIGRELLMDFIPLCAEHHQQIHETSNNMGIALQTPAAAIRKMEKIGKGRSKSITRANSLKGTSWIPKGRNDLVLMRSKIGYTSCKMQHDRLIGGPFPNYRMMDPREAVAYAKLLSDRSSQ